jgi:hypothetical protein
MKSGFDVEAGSIDQSQAVRVKGCFHFSKIMGL